jgi:hypothetical protein
MGGPKIARDFSVTVGLQYYGGRHVPLLIDIDLVFSNANRPNPNFSQILQLQSVVNSTYYGGFAIRKRFSRSVHFTASYTLGRAFNQNDSTGDTGSSPTDFTIIRHDYGTSSSDQRHRLVIQGVWQPTVSSLGLAAHAIDGRMMTPNVTATSGFPVSRTFPMRERLRLEVIGEAEKLFNTTNASCTTGGRSGALVSTFNAAEFRRITSTFNSRQIQLGGRLRF